MRFDIRFAGRHRQRLGGRSPSQKRLESGGLGPTVKGIGQMTIRIEDKPVLVARADLLSDPAEVIFVDAQALEGVEIRSGLSSLDCILARVTAHVETSGQKMHRKIEGIIRPMYD